MRWSEREVAQSCKVNAKEKKTHSCTFLQLRDPHCLDDELRKHPVSPSSPTEEDSDFIASKRCEVVCKEQDNGEREGDGT